MKRYRVRKSHTGLTLTSPPDWSAAELLNDFSFPWEERPIPFTEFRALWNEESVFFRFDCVDDDLVLGAGANGKERALGSDRVEIFLTPDLSLKPYFGFEMSPWGDVMDYSARHYRQFDRDWRCEGFEFAGQIVGRHYVVTGSIAMEALRELNVLKAGEREFFAGVYRAEFSHAPDGGVHQGWMAWVDPRTERPDFHVPESFGVFQLVD